MAEQKSNILFLIICSNTKAPQGDKEYEPAGFTLNVLGKSAAPVYTIRDKVRDLITSDKPSNDGTPMYRLPYNVHLKYGPDFGPQHKRAEGEYLSAAARYRGRFFEKLDPDGATLLMNTRHHVLIVSGLYGLLTPSEPIQCYSCNVTDRDEITRWWTANDLLTKTLAAYIEKFAIRKVFDFMAVGAYRNLINWDYLRGKTTADTLHAFTDQLVGDAALFPFGIITRRYLETPEATLIAIAPGHHESVLDYGVEVEYERGIIPTSRTARVERQPRRTSTVAAPKSDAVLAREVK